MFNDDCLSAVLILQEQSKVKDKTLDSFELDRIDRALDELVRKPGKRGTPSRLVRSARANALKVVVSRGQHVAFSIDQEDLHARKRGQVELALATDDFAEVDIRDWLDRTLSISEEQRWLLKATAAGFDAELLGSAMSLPTARVRERISRARRAAYTGYRVEVGHS